MGRFGGGVQRRENGSQDSGGPFAPKTTTKEIYPNILLRTLEIDNLLLIHVQGVFYRFHPVGTIIMVLT